MWFFLTIKKIVSVLTDEIPTVPLWSNEQINSKKTMDSDGTINFGEYHFTT